MGAEKTEPGTIIFFMAVTRLHILNMVILAGAGVVILLLSLLTANTLTMRGAGLGPQQWKFYLGRDILPDNILYPLLMIRDRVVLDNTQPSEQVALKLAYAEERYATSQALLKNEDVQLAISTVTKYQKYVIGAGYQALELENMDKSDIETALQAAQVSLERTEGLASQYPAHDFATIEQLRSDTKVLVSKLEERITKY